MVWVGGLEVFFCLVGFGFAFAFCFCFETQSFVHSSRCHETHYVDHDGLASEIKGIHYHA